MTAPTYSANLLLSGGRRIAVEAMPYFRARIEGFVPRACPEVDRTAATRTGFFLYNEAEVEGRVAQCGGRVADAIKSCAWSWLHEAMHLQLRHFDRCGARDWHTWNMAGDCAINGSLERLVAKRLILRPPGRLIPQDLGLPPDRSADEYYSLLLTSPEARERMGGQGEGGRCGSCATGRPIHGEPADGDPQAPSPDRRRQIDREVAQAIRAAEAKSPGTVPRDLAMWAEEHAATPTVDWRSELRRSARASLGVAAGDNVVGYDGPSRRQAGLGYGPGCPVLPRARGRIPNVVVGVDTSGSMSGLGSQVLGELDGLLRATGADVTLIACDTRVQAVRRVRGLAEAARSLKGGGGTSFLPIFEEVARLRPSPDYCVVVTDSYGPAPERDPGTPTTWCLVGGAIEAPARWGRVVVVRDPLRNKHL